LQGCQAQGTGPWRANFGVLREVRGDGIGLSGDDGTGGTRVRCSGPRENKTVWGPVADPIKKPRWGNWQKSGGKFSRGPVGEPAINRWW